LVIQREIGDEAFEPAAFVLEGSESLGLVHFEPGALGLPAIERLLADGAWRRQRSTFFAPPPPPSGSR
jgi:hypothetical protein